MYQNRDHPRQTNPETEYQSERTPLRRQPAWTGFCFAAKRASSGLLLRYPEDNRTDGEHGPGSDRHAARETDGMLCFSVSSRGPEGFSTSGNCFLPCSLPRTFESRFASWRGSAALLSHDPKIRMNSRHARHGSIRDRQAEARKWFLANSTNEIRSAAGGCKTKAVRFFPGFPYLPGTAQNEPRRVNRNCVCFGTSAGLSRSDWPARTPHRHQCQKNSSHTMTAASQTVSPIWIPQPTQ